MIRNYKKSVGRTIDTFGSNKKFHRIMKVLNYRLIKWTYLVMPMTHWVPVENFQAFKGMFDRVGRTVITITVVIFYLRFKFYLNL